MNSIFAVEDTQSSQANQNSPSWASSTRQVGYAVGVCSQQGKRPYQEDEYSVSL